eukprot:5844398-Lingulodinium_polyedra.AAC.1
MPDLLIGRWEPGEYVTEADIQEWAERQLEFFSTKEKEEEPAEEPGRKRKRKQGKKKGPQQAPRTRLSTRALFS